MNGQLTDDEKREYARRYEAAGHAVQSGVRMEIERFGDVEAAANGKHLRTGVNMAMAEHGALAQLLITKGLVTEREYYEAIAKGVENEKARYEQRLSEKLGTKIVLA